jgi:hypothetical protein
MTIHTGFRTPVQLTAEARAAADIVEGADPLTALLPSTENRTLDFDLDNESVGLPRAATFRSYDATAPYGREESVGARKGKLPAASIKLPLGELDQLRLQGAGSDTIGAALERKARQNAQSIAIRAIIARGELISTGKVTLNENNLVAEIDFGRDASLTTSAGTVHSNTAAPAVADLIAWLTTYRSFNGGNPGAAWLSEQYLQYLSLNTTIIALAYPGAAVAPTRISRAAVLEVLADLGIRGVRVYDEQYKDASGATVRPIAADRLVFTPSPDVITIDGGPLGSTQWGVPAEALNGTYGTAESEQAGIFAGAFGRSDPEGMDVLASSIFLPVPSDINATMAIEVY